MDKDQCSVVKRELFFAELASTLAMTLAAVARPAMLLSIGRNKGSLQDGAPSILAFRLQYWHFQYNMRLHWHI
jgi:hypothetical protein